LLNTKGSCFIDAVEIAFGCPTDTIVQLYDQLLPDTNPEETGFHPSVVNLLLLELYRTGLSEISCVPVNEDGSAIDEHRRCSSLIIRWLNIKGFRCVLQGPKQDTGEEHAIAFRDEKFIDPATMTASDEPTISIRSVWVLSVPTPGEQGDEVVSTESS